MIVRTYKYNIRPNKTTAAYLEKTLRTHCRLYNEALSWRIHGYEIYQTTVSMADQSKFFLNKRKSDPFLADCNALSLVQTLRRVDKSYQNFFRRVKHGETPGFPKFKPSDRFDTIHFGQSNGYKVMLPEQGSKWGKLRLTQTVDDKKVHHFVRVKFHRPLPKDAKQKQIAITREGNKWYLAIGLELPESYAEPCGNGFIGIDVGLKEFAFDSNGQTYGDTRTLERSLPELRRINRGLARKKNKKSNRRREYKKKLTAIHRKIRNQRRDLCNKTSKALVDQNKIIAVEDLNIKGMVRNKHLSRRISDAGWGVFLSQLAATAEQRGGEVVPVPPAGTSQQCSGCGETVPKDLSVRTHKCNHCGLEMDRDENAANNIKSRASKILADRAKPKSRKGSRGGRAARTKVKRKVASVSS